ncbi:peptidylprolyl isomerase [Paenibacillus abyssi]|uniref:Foldase protein PrsA n=1 Tax=Paenibacillus abyssi TaxID=1340531 RepID=A0A917CNN0_9BACL|nr:peptidylprolyl isomerase [Paenibacillus abyssi]GGF92624.1 foldase protein PrsA 1 [Paenibacillus abyssi]
MKDSENNGTHDQIAQGEPVNGNGTTAGAAASTPSGLLNTKIWIGISFVLCALLVAMIAFGPEGKKAESSEAVATVNGVAIGKDKLYDALVGQGGTAALENLITEELIRQEAEKANVTVSESDIDGEIGKIRVDYPSDEEFQSVLQQNGLTEEVLRKQIKIQLEMRKVLEPQIQVTDEELQQYYDQHKDSLGTPEQVQASHILVGTQEEAEQILEELKQGADFAALAKEKSTDPGTKDNGGDLGYFGRGAMDPAFEEAAFALDNNEISGVVQSSFGYHIIKTVDHKAAVTPTFEEKKDEIREDLINEKLYNLSGTWLQEIRTAAKIDNKLQPEQDNTEEAVTNNTVQ